MHMTFLHQVFALQASTKLESQKDCDSSHWAEVCLWKMRPFLLWVSLFLPAFIFKMICDMIIGCYCESVFKILCLRKGRRETHMLAVEMMLLYFLPSRLSYFQKRVKYRLTWYLSFFVSVSISQMQLSLFFSLLPLVICSPGFYISFQGWHFIHFMIDSLASL